MQNLSDVPFLVESIARQPLDEVGDVDIVDWVTGLTSNDVGPDRDELGHLVVDPAGAGDIALVLARGLVDVWRVDLDYENLAALGRLGASLFAATDGQATAWYTIHRSQGSETARVRAVRADGQVAYQFEVDLLKRRFQANVAGGVEDLLATYATRGMVYDSDPVPCSNVTFDPGLGRLLWHPRKAREFAGLRAPSASRLRIGLILVTTGESLTGTAVWAERHDLVAIRRDGSQVSIEVLLLDQAYRASLSKSEALDLADQLRNVPRE